MAYIKLKELLKQTLTESQTGLWVTPSTQSDFEKIKRWLSRSSYYAEPDYKSKSYFFPEEKSAYGQLEMDLDNEFNQIGISVRYEGV